MNVYTLRDTKAEAFNLPFFSDNHATAMRSLTVQLEQDPNMQAFAEDFVLYCVGTFDQASGRLTPRDPEQVVDVNELRTPEVSQLGVAS